MMGLTECTLMQNTDQEKCILELEFISVHNVHNVNPYNAIHEIKVSGLNHLHHSQSITVK